MPGAAAPVGSDGRRLTAEGFAVTCSGTPEYCYFFRPGPTAHTAPVVTTVSGSAWGFGVPGLSVRAEARLGTDLTGDDAWTGTEPPLQLLEAYAEYADRGFTARAGRVQRASRLGIAGFDGGQALLRAAKLGLDAEAYAGLGLGRGSLLPLTSPVLNPLNDFRPSRRQIVAGGSLGWSGAWAAARVEYQREVDRRSRYFASERMALSGSLTPIRHWSLAGGAEYDLAQGWWGSADLRLQYNGARFGGGATVRRYRPFFPLWTIWGAFSPVPYTAGGGNAWFRPIPALLLHADAEWFGFSDDGAETPLVDAEDSGWRAGGGARYDINPDWSVEGAYLRSHGPGAAAQSWTGAVEWSPSQRVSLRAFGSRLFRPLEFRFSDATVTWLGFTAAVLPTDRSRVEFSAAHGWEDRDRPDAASFDLNQTRISARVVLDVSSRADRLPLPPARRSRPAQDVQQ